MGLTEWLLGKAFFTEESGPAQSQLPKGERAGTWVFSTPVLLPAMRWGTSSALGEKEARCPNPAHTI